MVPHHYFNLNYMKYLAYLIPLSVPVWAHAQATDFKDFIVTVLQLLTNFIQIFVALLVLGILYGVVLFMINSDNEQKRESIRGYLFSAVIGLAVVMGMWGVIELIQGSLFGGAFGFPQLKAP